MLATSTCLQGYESESKGCDWVMMWHVCCEVGVPIDGNEWNFEVESGL